MTWGRIWSVAGSSERTTRGFVKAEPVAPASVVDEPAAPKSGPGPEREAPVVVVVEVGPVQPAPSDPRRAFRSVRDEIVSAAARRRSVFSAPDDVAEVVDLEPASEMSEPASTVEAPGDRSDVRGRPAPPAPGGLG